jgi:hypothetical protein
MTLGSPFQSIWRNFSVNALHNVSAGFGQAPWFQYLDAIAPPGAVLLLPLLWLAIIGSARAPLLAATSLAVLVSHSVLAHKEYRFIVFTLMSLPILIGFGAATLARILERRGLNWSIPLAVFLAALVPAISYAEWTTDPMHPSRNKGVLRAFVAAHSEEGLCGLGVADYLWAVTGGYTYLHRATPIYYAEYPVVPVNSVLLNAQTRSLSRALELDKRFHGSLTPLPIRVVVAGGRIPQFPGSALLRNTQRFNYLIAEQGHAVPGYHTVRCFANEADSPLRTVCLLRRAGDCREH